jgi:hypothetical protein
MAKTKLTLNISQLKSFDIVDRQIENYKKELVAKCEKLVTSLAEVGIKTGGNNVGGFGRYISFSMDLEQTTNGYKAIMYATETGKIINKWQTKDGVKEAEVSPLLMAEFGSGINAMNPNNMPGVGRGSFPNQTHAWDADGWYYLDMDDVWHHEYGIVATQPMLKARQTMEQQIRNKIKEIF